MSRPLTFKFTGPNNTEFSCPIQCSQCTAHKADGNRCTKRTCIGVPVCWVHLLKNHKLRIRDSAHGKGLFVHCNASGANDIIFHPGQEIVRYYGEGVTMRVLDQRYGDSTAPYGVACNPDNVRGRRRGRGRGGRRTFEDAACVRGVGSLANHGGAHANAELTCVNSRVVLKATTGIRNYREVLVNYGDEYWFDEENTQHTTRRMKQSN